MLISPAALAASRKQAAGTMQWGAWWRYSNTPVDTPYGTNHGSSKAEPLTGRMRAMRADEMPNIFTANDMIAAGRQLLHFVCLPLRGVTWSAKDRIGNADGTEMYEVVGVLDVVGQDSILTNLAIARPVN